VITAVHDQVGAVRVTGQRNGSRQPRRGGRPAVAAAARPAGPRDRADLSGRVDAADAVVPAVGDQQAAVGQQRKPGRCHAGADRGPPIAARASRPRTARERHDAAIELPPQDAAPSLNSSAPSGAATTLLP
jgi:hypothetical protein